MRYNIGERPDIPEDEEWFDGIIDYASDTESIVEHFGGVEGLRILDCPCGRGEMCHQLAQRGAIITGIDVNERFIEKARSGTASGNPAFMVGDMLTSDLPEGQDAILNWHNSFGFYGEDDNIPLLRRFHDCLAEGGQLLIEVENIDEMRGRYPQDRSADTYWDDSDKTMHYRYGEDECIVRYYTQKEMVAMMEEAGFSEVRIHGMYFSDLSGKNMRIIYEGVRGTRRPFPTDATSSALHRRLARTSRWTACFVLVLSNRIMETSFLKQRCSYFMYSKIKNLRLFTTKQSFLTTTSQYAERRWYSER